MAIPGWKRYLEVQQPCKQDYATSHVVVEPPNKTIRNLCQIDQLKTHQVFVLGFGMALKSLLGSHEYYWLLLRWPGI